MQGGPDVVVEGPLAPYADGFWVELAGLGYQRGHAVKQMRLLAHLSEWIGQRKVAPAELSAECVAEFFLERKQSGQRQLFTPRAGRALLAYLRQAGVIPEKLSRSGSGPLGVLLGRYRRFLLDQRGLAEATAAHYEVVARLFCDAVGAGQSGSWESLSAADVSRFVTKACSRPVKVSPREMVSALRSFLRFLHVEGVSTGPLAQAVPSYASWRAAGLPKALTPEQVRRLLGSCDRRSAKGRRDYAVLVLLSRLGLRAGGVAGLRLEDFDWHAGEVTVHGKGQRLERLPLPVDVGKAVAAYLQRGRPRVHGRALFLRVDPPLVGIGPTGVTWVVYDACDRAGLPRAGAHRLRHSVATQILRGGGSLTEVGQVLRHARVGTTAIYAKVDQDALGRLARPWPGAEA